MPNSGAGERGEGGGRSSEGGGGRTGGSDDSIWNPFVGYSTYSRGVQPLFTPIILTSLKPLKRQRKFDTAFFKRLIGDTVSFAMIS